MKKFFGFFRSVLGSFNKYLVVCLVCLLCYSFSSVSAYTTYLDCGGHGNNNNLCIEFNYSEYYTLDNDVNMVMPNRQFNYFGDQNYKANFHHFDSTYYSNIFMFWGTGNKLYSVLDSSYANRTSLFSIDKVCMYNGTDYDGMFNQCVDSAVGGYFCNDFASNYNISFDTFKSNINGYSPSKFVYMIKHYGYNQLEGGILCGIYGNVSYCVKPNGIDGFNNVCTSTHTLLDNNIAPLGSAFDYYDSYFKNSPLTAGSTNYPIIGYNSGSVVSTGSNNQGSTVVVVATQEDITNDFAIQYYEDNLFSPDYMCYAGLKYGDNTAGDFPIAGSGSTIFEIYEIAYGTGTYDRMVNWLDTRRKAYNRCVNGEFTGNCPLNSRDNAFQQYIKYLYYRYSNVKSADIIDYCSLKLLSQGNTTGNPYTGNYSGTGTYVPSTSGSNQVSEAIQDIVSNPDYYGVGSSGSYAGITLIIPTNTGSGSLSDFVGDIDITDTNINSIFDKFYNALDNWFVFNGNSTNGILPSYIIIAFLFVVLFRILRR